MMFCKHLWALMQQDMDGRQPQPGWNLCPGYGPVYLMLEKKEHRNRSFTDAAGNKFPVDGHMLMAKDVLFAATRAWNWNHGFKPSDLAVQMVNAAAEAAQLGQGTAQSSAANSEAVKSEVGTPTAAMEVTPAAATSEAGTPTAAMEVDAGTPKAMEVEAGTPTAAKEEAPVAASSSAAGSAAAADSEMTSADDGEVPTSKECQALLTMIEGSKWYSGLPTREVLQLFALGLRLNTKNPEYLGCMHCRNASKKPLHLSSIAAVREHFATKHLEQPAQVAQPAPPSEPPEEAVADELLGVWAPNDTPEWAANDAAGRLRAGNNTVDEVAEVAWSERLLSELRQSEGFVGKFIQRVVDVLIARDAGHGPAFCRALDRLTNVPAILRSMLQARTTRQLSWTGLANMDFKSMDNIEVWSKDENGYWSVATIRSTQVTGAMMSLFIQGFRLVYDDCGLDEAGRQAASRSVAVLFNEACNKAEQQQRLLVQPDQVGLKYEHTPGNAAFKYGSQNARLTRNQQRTGVLEGRRRRELFADETI